jgi:enamine deaminase RidA (YjgF/YER057c/UK114 family)
MGPDERARKLGLDTSPLEPGKLNLCARVGDLYMTSGHTSDLKGTLGDELTVGDGYSAARDCAMKICRSLRQAHGTLDGLRVVKVLGCVNSTPTFIDQHLVINGASDVFHEIFGEDGDGFHARSALGFASLPTGVAVEVEAVFEIVFEIPDGS